MPIQTHWHVSLFAFLSFIALASSETFLFQLTAFVSAPTCVQSCVSGASVFGIDTFSCGVSAPQTCLCNGDAGQSLKVSSFAFTCASSACGNNDGASAAARVWSSYCVANNANPATAGATGGVPTAGATAGSGGSPATGSVPTASTPTPTGGSGKSKISERYNLAVGIVIGIVLPGLLTGV